MAARPWRGASARSMRWRGDGGEVRPGRHCLQPTWRRCHGGELWLSRPQRSSGPRRPFANLVIVLAERRGGPADVGRGFRARRRGSGSSGPHQRHARRVTHRSSPGARRLLAGLRPARAGPEGRRSAGECRRRGGGGACDAEEGATGERKNEPFSS